MNSILTVAIKEFGRNSLKHPNLGLQSVYQELKKTAASQYNEPSLFSCALINWITFRVELNRNCQLTPQDWLTCGNNVDNDPQAGDIVISEIVENSVPQILISVLVWNYTDKDVIKCLCGDEKKEVSIKYISKKSILGIRRLLYKSATVSV